MPTYGFNYRSGELPAQDFNSLTPAERQAVYEAFRASQANINNQVFGAGNWEPSGGSVLFAFTSEDGKTVTLTENKSVKSTVFVPPDQLPPFATLDPGSVGDSAATVGVEGPGGGGGGDVEVVLPTAEPAPVLPEPILVFDDPRPAPPVTEAKPVNIDVTLPGGDAGLPAENQTTPVLPQVSSPEPVNDPGTGFNDEELPPGLSQTDSPGPVSDGPGTGFNNEEELPPVLPQVSSPEPVSDGPGTGFGDGTGAEDGTGTGGTANTGSDSNPDPAATATQVGNQLVRQQPNRQAITTQTQQGDWRVRLSLAPNSDYLYNDPNILSSGTNSILLPLLWTNGVIFPYTPEISSAYRADYDTFNLTHSNYRGYFYKSSYVDAVNINAVFTAQDTGEADYLLAVIHFFKSATKMFYGKDSQAGAPPPLVFLNGLGAFQYNNHPCLITQFNYTLPSDVDYIRAGSSRFTGQNLFTQRPRQNVATNPISGAVNRLKNAFGFVPQGGIAPRPSPPSLNSANTTYVPTKINIQLSLLPIQNRKQVSQSFNVKEYASGSLLRKGYW